MLATSFSTSASSRSGGTARLTSPRSRACVGADELAGDQHFHRLLGRHVAQQRHAGRGAEQPVVDAADGKARLGRGHGQVALRHQLAARRGGDALHARDHRHRQLQDAEHHPAALREQASGSRPASGCRDHFLEVVAGAEGLAGGGEHHHARRLVGAPAASSASCSAVQHFLAQRVEIGGTVHGQRHHAAPVPARSAVRRPWCPHRSIDQRSASTRRCASTLRASALEVVAAFQRRHDAALRMSPGDVLHLLR